MFHGMIQSLVIQSAHLDTVMEDLFELLEWMQCSTAWLSASRSDRLRGVYHQRTPQPSSDYPKRSSTIVTISGKLSTVLVLFGPDLSLPGAKSTPLTLTMSITPVPIVAALLITSYDIRPIRKTSSRGLAHDVLVI